MKKKILLVPLAILLIASLLACAAPTPAPAPAPAPVTAPAPAPAPAQDQEVFNWRLQSVWGAGLNAMYLAPMLETIKELSNGRMIVDLYSMDELVSSVDLIPAMQQGTIDLTWNTDMFMYSPADISMFSGVFPFMTVEALEVDVLWKHMGLDEIWKEAYDEVPGVTFLDMSSIDPANLITTTPVESWEDLQGLKLFGEPAAEKFFDEMGITSIFMTTDDMVMSLQTGIIEGTWICGAWEAVTAWGLRDVCDYFMTNELGRYALGWWVSTDSWEALPPDLQALWMLSFEGFNYRRIVEYHYGEPHYRVGIENPFIITSLPDEDWEKVVALRESIYDDLAATSDRSRRVIEIIRDYQAGLEKAGHPYR